MMATDSAGSSYIASPSTSGMADGATEDAEEAAEA